MDLVQVVALCRLFERDGLQFWIDGGWGVDALLHRQTRPHSDLDLAVHDRELPRYAGLLTAQGFTREQRPGDAEWNWVFERAPNQSVDLHGFVLDQSGAGILGDAADGNIYPSGALDGRGMLGDLEVCCISAHHVLQFRNGFDPRAVDRLDVAALCRHFDLSLPLRFRTD